MNSIESIDLPYQVLHINSHVCRINWHGALIDSFPAENAERLCEEFPRDPELRVRADVEIDLAQCASVNSLGIAFLIYLRRRLLTHDRRLVLIGVPQSLLKMLQMISLDTSFDIRAVAPLHQVDQPQDCRHSSESDDAIERAMGAQVSNYVVEDTELSAWGKDT